MGSYGFLLVSLNGWRIGQHVTLNLRYTVGVYHSCLVSAITSRDLYLNCRLLQILGTRKLSRPVGSTEEQ